MKQAGGTTVRTLSDDLKIGDTVTVAAPGGFIARHNGTRSTIIDLREGEWTGLTQYRLADISFWLFRDELSTDTPETAD